MGWGGMGHTDFERENAHDGRTLDPRRGAGGSHSSDGQRDFLGGGRGTRQRRVRHQGVFVTEKGGGFWEVAACRTLVGRERAAGDEICAAVKSFVGSLSLFGWLFCISASRWIPRIPFGPIIFPHCDEVVLFVNARKTTPAHVCVDR